MTKSIVLLFKKLIKKYQLTDWYWRKALTRGQYIFFEAFFTTKDSWETTFEDFKEKESLMMHYETMAKELLSAGFLKMKVIGDHDSFWKNKRVYKVKLDNPKVERLRKKIKRDRAKLK